MRDRCPASIPAPYRGKRNEPERVTLVAQQIADLRGMTYEEVLSPNNRKC